MFDFDQVEKSIAGPKDAAEEALEDGFALLDDLVEVFELATGRLQLGHLLVVGINQVLLEQRLDRLLLRIVLFHLVEDPLKSVAIDCRLLGLVLLYPLQDRIVGLKQCG